MVLKIEIPVPKNLTVIDFIVSLLNEFYLMKRYKPFIELLNNYTAVKFAT